MHLGCADTAYGYGICNIHVAYITRSSWDINIYLKTAILYCTSTIGIGIGIDLVPIGHILRIFFSQGVGGGVKPISFFSRPPPWSSVTETHACINPSGEME